MEKEGLQGGNGTPVRLDALGASTTLASNKSLLRIEHLGERGQRRLLRLGDQRERHEQAQDNPWPWSRVATQHAESVGVLQRPAPRHRDGHNDDASAETAAPTTPQ